ncbi:MAG TPA: MgtC/SapB family protein [Candidatus Acidoferrum sp.]|nr:MgtC/SapB family protein [Candidatus Acidoferrum sp.]
MLSFHEIFLRMLFAAVLGTAIGVERDLRRRPAGIRTSAFVCLATALFTILSNELARMWGDTGTTRIASNIVQGIGFLGAGAILKDSMGLVGMTTAATIFVEAAIGMAAGGGMYKVAGAATGIVLFGLVVLSWAAEKMHLKSHMVMFRFTTSHAENVATEIQQLMAGLKIVMNHFRVSIDGTNSVVEFEAEVNGRQQERIVQQLNRRGVLTEVISVEGRYE